MTDTAAPEPRPITPTILLNNQYLPSSHPWNSEAGQQHSPFELDTFIRQAQRAEAAGVDALFVADFSGVNRASLQTGPPLAAFEPFQLSAVVATATSRIAVMPTVSTLYTHPFSFARNLASLDRIARGRAWINIVSSFRDGTAIGMARDIPRDQRHRQTEEFIDIARHLWTSWPVAANQPDSASGRFIRGDLITDVDFDGGFYRQHGPIDIPPYRNDFPYTLEATSSLEGVRLAAKTADAVFAGTPTLGAAREMRRIVRREARAAGRNEGAVALLPGAFIALDDHEAVPDTGWQQRQRATRHTPTAAHAVEMLRTRLPRLNLGNATPASRVPRTVIDDDPDVVFETLGSRYLPAWDVARTPGLSVADFAVEVLGLGEHAHFSGTAERVGDELRRWIDEGGVDGFQLILGNRFDDVCDRVLPRVFGGR